TSTDQNPSHTYYETGDFSVTLNASNMYEYRVIELENYITVTDGNESLEGSGSLGVTGTVSGEGASPEPPSNVEIKVQSQKYILAGNHTKFEFTPGATCIDFVEFDSKKTLGKTTTLVEQLKGKSVLAPIEPGGLVYKYLNIWVGNEGFATSENIENAIVGFRVSKAELTENETADSVVLQRYADGKWNPLSTSKTEEDDQYIYYEASTPGFSPFAITFGSIRIVEYSTILYNGTLQNSGPSIASNSVAKPTTLTESKMTTKEMSKATDVIRFFVVFMVVLLIGLAVREKRKQ
ncbi:MAG: PGF-pre-PGF domain-containing protein, partial [Methanosarcina sp.]